MAQAVIALSHLHQNQRHGLFQNLEIIALAVFVLMAVVGIALQINQRGKEGKGAWVELFPGYAGKEKCLSHAGLLVRMIKEDVMKKTILAVICLTLIAPSFVYGEPNPEDCPFGIEKVRVDGRRTGVVTGTVAGTSVAIGACALGIFGGFFTFGVTAAMGCGAGALLGAGTGAYIGAEVGDTFDYECVR